MKVKHIPGFRRWMKEVIDFHPTYNDVKLTECINYTQGSSDEKYKK